MKLSHIMVCVLVLSAAAGVSTAQEAAGAASTKPMPILPSGPCVGDPAQILAEHGTLWGHKGTLIVGQATLILYDKMVDYFTCMGLAQRNGDACNAVPHFINMSQGYDDEESPRSRCRNNLVKLLYLTGNADAAFCRANTHIIDTTAEKFCATVKDMPGACQAAARLLKLDSVPKECYALYPRTLADCGGNTKCRSTAKLYGAIKSGSTAGLAPYERAAFEAFQTKSTESCAIIQKDLATTYCTSRSTYAKSIIQIQESQREKAAKTKPSPARKAQVNAEPVPPAPILCTTCQVYQDQMSGQGKRQKKAVKPAVKK